MYESLPLCPISIAPRLKDRFWDYSVELQHLVECILVISAFIMANMSGSWIRAELIDHGKLLKLMKFLTGLDDIYQPIRSSLLLGKSFLKSRMPL
ncbi:hypothetical protein Tco_0721370 [Tanacetum coccineum]